MSAKRDGAPFGCSGVPVTARPGSRGGYRRWSCGTVTVTVAGAELPAAFVACTVMV
jgi:hypothetical protein